MDKMVTAIAGIAGVAILPFAIWAFLDGANYLWGVGAWGAIGAYLLLHMIPVVSYFGGVAVLYVAFNGVLYVWGWTWWQGALLLIPNLIIGSVILGAYGIVGMAQRMRA